MATNDYAFGQFEQLLIERVSPRVHDMTLPGDDVAWTIMRSFEPETVAGRPASSTSGYDHDNYEASWRIMTQRAGRFTGRDIRGNTLTKMGHDDELITGQSADALYLDPAYTPMRSYVKIFMTLRAFQGQLACNRKQIVTDMAANGIEKVAADHTVDAVFNVRHQFAALAWSPGYGVMGTTVAGTNILGGTAASVLTATSGVQTLKTGTPYRFRVGERYVAYGPSGGVPTTARAGLLNTPGVFRCIDINIDELSVQFESETGEGTISITAGDQICVEGMYDATNTIQYNFHGFEQLTPNDDSTTQYPGSPGANYTPQKLSYLSTMEDDQEDASNNPTAYPTPERIAESVDKLVQAGLPAPPILVAEPSIWTLYSQLEREQHSMYTVPQGAQFTASGGVSQPRIGHGTHSFTHLSSAMCDPNKIYGFQPSDWKRFIPLGDATIHWITTGGGVAGAPSVFRLVVQGRQLTEVAVADYEVYCALGCTNPRGQLRMKGIHSQRTT